MRHLYPLLFAVLALAAGPAFAQITVANSGNWSDPNTWSTGAVPGVDDDVVIQDSTVTIDIADAVARDVTISGDGELRTEQAGIDNTLVGLTVFGDLVVSGADAELKPLSNKGPNPGNTNTSCSDTDDFGFGESYHRLTVYGNIDNSTGGTFDMRRGSTSGSDTCNGEPSASFIDLIFAGGEDATFELGPYDNNDNQLFRTEIAKTEGATVTLLSDATIDNNSRATFTLTSGYLDTGDNRFTLISNNSSVVVGGSPASYVIGELARGLPKSGDGQYSRDYPVGDADAYRPATVYATERPSDDQFFGVRVINGDADTGSSTLEGGLMDVSPVRYYAFEWYFFDSSDPISIDRVEISYGPDDQVPDGSMDFVVATSTDDRATWMNSGATPETTSLATPPTAIRSDSLMTWTFNFEVQGTDIVNDVYHAAIGTTSAFATSSEGRPVAGALGLTAAPNPSSGATALTFTLDEAADVTVEVFDVLGRRVATLADGSLPAGDQALTWDAGALAPGLYVVRLQAGSEAASRTVTLAR